MSNLSVYTSGVLTERAWSQSPTPSGIRSITISSSRSPSSTVDRRRREEELAKRKEELVSGPQRGAVSESLERGSLYNWLSPVAG